MAPAEATMSPKDCDLCGLERIYQVKRGEYRDRREVVFDPVDRRVTR